MIRILAAALLASSALIAVPAAAETIIDNTSGATGGQWAPFGSPNTATYGELFTVSGSDTYLNSFSLYLNDTSAGSVQLKGYVASWDGTKAGTIDYTSDVRTMTGTGSYATVEFAFAPDMTLAAGNYVAFLSVSDLGAQGMATFAMPQGGSLGANFVYYNNGTNFAALTQHAWDDQGGGWSTDVLFKADLTAGAVATSEDLPEPVSLAVLGTALVGLGAVRRRRSGK